MLLKLFLAMWFTNRSTVVTVSKAALPGTRVNSVSNQVLVKSSAEPMELGRNIQSVFSHRLVVVQLRMLPMGSKCRPTLTITKQATWLVTLATTVTPLPTNACNRPFAMAPIGFLFHVALVKIVEFVELLHVNCFPSFSQPLVGPQSSLQMIQSWTDGCQDRRLASMAIQSLINVEGKSIRNKNDWQVKYKHLLCFSGYVRRGAQAASICRNSVWSTPDPCVPDSCGPPKTFDNAVLRPRSTTSNANGATVAYECVSGYRLNGTNLVSICQGSTWTNIDPCVPVESKSWFYLPLIHFFSFKWIFQGFVELPQLSVIPCWIPTPFPIQLALPWDIAATVATHCKIQPSIESRVCQMPNGPGPIQFANRYKCHVEKPKPFQMLEL